jgi:aromatic-L-amino-acid decarboxylase
VDGAYGLPAAAAQSTAHLFEGVARADSVAIDAHKWLFMPKACGVLLVRRREDLEAALAHDEDYLPHERDEPHAVDITLEYSRPFRALKLWLGLRAHGAAAFRHAIERNLEQARLLYDAVTARNELQAVCGPPPLSIVPFRHTPPGVADLDGHNTRLVARLQESGEVWVASARIDGRVCLRPCFVNFRTSDEDVLALVEETVWIGRELAGAA